MQSDCHEDSARCEGELEATAPPPIPHNASFEAWLGMRPNAGDPKQPRPTPRHDATAHDTATRQREREGHDQRPQPPEPQSTTAHKETIPSQGGPKGMAQHIPPRHPQSTSLMSPVASWGLYGKGAKISLPWAGTRRKQNKKRLLVTAWSPRTTKATSSWSRLTPQHAAY